MTCVDDLGLIQKFYKNMFRTEGKGSTYIIDDCFVDGDPQGFIRMQADSQKMYITNSVFRNSTNLLDPWDGLGIAARGNTQQVIFVQNTTFYLGTNRPYQSWGTHQNVTFDHCTFARFGGVTDGNFGVGQTVNLTFTNNVIMDVGFEGEDNPDGEVELLPVDLLNTSDYGTDDDRNIVIKNNVYGWSPEIREWIGSKEDRTTFVFQDSISDSIMSVYPKMVKENNIEEDVVFSDAPDIAVCVGYAESRYTSGDMTDIRADRNGIGPVTEPETIGPAEDEFDFDYNTDATAYTLAEGGFPAGDLNWFPTKKAEWETWVTAVEEAPNQGVPTEFALNQNYPNPFNPTTTIEYSLNAPSKVRMVVYNALGQMVRTLVNNQSQKAGSYSLQWDGRDNAGNFVSSGVYFYRLDADQMTMSKKMLLVK
jgi:hypothetical protein